MDYIIWVIVAIVILIITLVATYAQMPRAKKNVKTKASAQPTTVEDEVVVGEEFSEEPCCESVPENSITEEPVEEEFLIKVPESSVSQEEAPVVPTNNIDEVPIQTKQDEIPLTNVKGVGEKRATQLKAIGINTVKDLAQASATNLAKELDISPKITVKLIEDAKQQLQQQ